MGAKNIMQIQLQKRLLEEQISLADRKLDRLGDILQKKAMRRTDFGLPKADPSNEKITNFGVTLGELRLSPTKRANYNTIIVEPEEPVPSAFTKSSHPKLTAIRDRNLINLVAKTQIKKMAKKREVDIELKERNRKKIPKVKVPESMLPNRYLRGELPCTIEHGTFRYLSWACPLENLDYEYYLPIFFDGLQVKETTVKFIARQGIEDMLYASRGNPGRVLPVIPKLARPLRNALAKFDIDIMLGTLKTLEQLLTCNEEVGEVLMPYGKQFLAPLSFFMDKRKNIGDKIDYGQRNGDDVGEEITKVLELMETRGGPNALRSIQFSIPVYQSCVKRPDAHHQRDQGL